MIRASLRALAAALGLRWAPASPTTSEPVPTGDSCYSAPGRPVVDPPLAAQDLANAEAAEALEEERGERLLGPLGRRALEVTVEQALWPGMPETWPCRCGGRPFVGKTCPRCGRTEQEARA